MVEGEGGLRCAGKRYLGARDSSFGEQHQENFEEYQKDDDPFKDLGTQGLESGEYKRG